MANGFGYGFRGCSPPWPYVGRGRGGLPRCWHAWGGMVPPYGRPMPAAQVPYSSYGEAWTATPYYGGASAPWGMPQGTSMTREQELSFLQDQAQAIKEQLEQIGARIRDLEGKETS